MNKGFTIIWESWRNVRFVRKSKQRLASVTIGSSGASERPSPTADEPAAPEDSFTARATTPSGLFVTFPVRIVIESVEDMPRTIPQRLSTNEDSPLQISLQATDPDGPNTGFAYHFRTSANFPGTISNSNSEITFNPDADYHGPATIEYAASNTPDFEEQDLIYSAIQITVLPIDDGPRAEDLFLAVNEDQRGIITRSVVDPEGNRITYELSSPPSNGTVSLFSNSDGYTPSPNFHGSDSYTVTATSLSQSATYQVNIEVSPVNDPPHARISTLSTPEDTPLLLTFDASDIDGDSLTVTHVSEPDPTVGTITSSPEGFIFTPAEDFNGITARLDYTVEDPSGLSASSRAQINVTPVNDSALATDFSVELTNREDASATLSASDVDSENSEFI